MNPVYLDTARLLTQVAPLVFVDDTFALKGGTAINLFVRDMPRLSVDLDLVFPDHTLPRDEALARINEAIRQAAERLKTRGLQTHAPAAAAGEKVAPSQRNTNATSQRISRTAARTIASKTGCTSVVD